MIREQNKCKLPITLILTRRLPRLKLLRDDRIRAALVIEVVALATGVPAVEIAAPTRCNARAARAARARQVAMYLAYISWKWPLARVGAAFQRDRTTAGHACRMIEEMRDDEAFDAQLEQMETCLKASPEIGATPLLAPDLSEMPLLEGPKYDGSPL